MNRTQKYAWIFWLESILYRVLRSRLIIAGNSAEDLEIDPARPVCFIFPYRSVVDLLIAIHHAKKLGLMAPGNHKFSDKSRSIPTALFIGKRGFWQIDRQYFRRPWQRMNQLVKLVQTTPDLELQLIPVSIFWGRALRKEHSSLFKLLFYDDDASGLLQRWITMVVHCRDVSVAMGKPILLRTIIDPESDGIKVARKLRRVFRVHFKRQRIQVLGPEIYDRGEMIGSILNSPRTIQSIKDEARRRKRTIFQIEEKARGYIDEISAQMSNGAIRFFNRALQLFWSRIYCGIEVANISQLKSIPEDAELVFLSNHRSHADYLLIGYVLFHHGFQIPHTAAGVNLNFWPAGPMLRRAGAFFLRRSFGGDRLYTTVFTEYLQFLVSKGFWITFFPEGGRSRTGRLLAPKTGLISMLVQNYLRERKRKIFFIPVHVNYDRIAEVKTYAKELRGAEKKPESIRQVLGLRRLTQSHFGNAYISFGVPIDLHEAMNSSYPDWSKEDCGDERPPWLHNIVTTIAETSFTSINGMAVVTSSSLVTMISLAMSPNAITETKLVESLDLLLELTRELEPAKRGSIVRSSSREIINSCEKAGLLRRFKDDLGDIVFLDEKIGSAAGYYRNSIFHMFAIHGLIVSFLRYAEERDYEFVVSGCCEFMPFINQEFYLGISAENFRNVVESALNQLVKCGILIANLEEGQLRVPAKGSVAAIIFQAMVRGISGIVDRYLVAINALIETRPDQRDRQTMEKQCRSLAQRVALLDGRTDPEVFEKASFKSCFDVLAREGYWDRRAGFESREISRLSKYISALESPSVRLNG